MDEIVEEFERLYKENIDLKDRLSMLVDQINNYKTMENTLKETLVTAQKTADELTESAQKKSELIIKEAEGKAREIIDNAHTKVLEIKKEFDEYRKQMQVFRSRFKNLLETQLEILQQEFPTYEDIDNESLPKG